MYNNAITWSVLCQVTGLTSMLYMLLLNSFPNTSFSDHPKFKDAADTTEIWPLKDFKIYCIQNIVIKGEIAHFEQFHLFPQCFP